MKIPLKNTTLLQHILRPLSFVYSAVQTLRALFYRYGLLRTNRLPGYVISIGNLEAGGTGKSPVTMAIVEILREKGFTPAILTRGYKSGLKAEESVCLLGEQIIMQPQETAHFHADEARMQAAKLETVPVIVGRNRLAAAKRYLQSYEQPSHWILDDGMQHLKIERDLNIVLLNYQYPFDNLLTLPSGHLREGPHALSRADLVFLTRAKINEGQVSLRPYYNGPVTPVSFAMSTPLPWKHSRPFTKSTDKSLLLLGIAGPDRLVSHLKDLNIQIYRSQIVGDHQPFEFSNIVHLASDCDVVITTEKDVYRQEDSFSSLGKPVYIIRLDLDITCIKSALPSKVFTT